MIEIKHKETGEVQHTIDADTLKGADLSVIMLNGADLNGADLRGAELISTFLIDTNLSGADLSGADMTAIQLSNADLSNANLSDANLINADLSGANLSGTNLSGTDLTSANLHGADLSGADLSGAALWHTNLSYCLTLHLAKGLETIVHHSPSSLDDRTLRASVKFLPDIFLQGVGYNEQNIVKLRAVYAEGSRQSVENEHRSITFNLEVPKEFKVPCEQYLMYFVQFLRNFGVEVNAELKHSAQEVLFTVTPTDERQALENIAEALNIYLQMSSASQTSLMTVERDIELSTFKANILHYQGQITLLQATMQAKDATIFAHQTSIENLKSMLSNAMSSSTLVVSSQESKAKPQESKEEVREPLVALKKFEFLKVIEVNVPELYKRVKRLFSNE